MAVRMIAIALILTTPAVPTPARASSPQIIEPSNAREHFGELRTVCGKVRSTSVWPVRGRPTLLSFGKRWPSQDLTVVVWVEVRDHLGRKAERLPGEEICVTGIVVRESNKPMIHVQIPQQIARMADSS